MSLFSFRSNRSASIKISSLTIHHEYEGHAIPIKVFLERRNNFRVAFGQTSVLLRIPANSSQAAIDKNISWAKQWINKQLLKNPALAKRFEINTYRDGDVFTINTQEFVIHIKRDGRKTVKIKREGSQLIIILPLNNNAELVNKSVKSALSRFFAKLYIDEVRERIYDLNARYFNERINSIKIKYNKSNWGSCSAKGNLNISSRLLFAPKEVQDYVFIHELTHLKELNHSQRFWNIVARIDPNYKRKEKWLKANSHLLDF